MTKYLMGLMSGTSFDGVDAVLMNADNLELVAQSFLPYSAALREDCVFGCRSEMISLRYLSKLRDQITKHYIEAANQLMIDNISAAQILAIGAHGQTIYHDANSAYPYSWQLLNGAMLSAKLGITVVSDFRNADLALGGQGAPLAPLYHHQLFDLSKGRVVLNLGGIANISYLDQKGQLRGFDTGPANCLLDAWCSLQTGQPYDHLGNYAASGQLQRSLLEQLTKDPYFSLPPPKSADKAQFSLAWLSEYLPKQYAPENIQATLLALTVTTVSDAIKKYCPNINELLVCGGGAHNLYLIECLKSQFKFVTTAENYGINGDYIEAMMMAWLAKERLLGHRLELETVTGSKQPVILGAIYA